MTYAQAIKRLPACCECAVENCVSDTGENMESIRSGVEHELSLHSERQDGCISEEEARKCLRFLDRLRGPGAEHNNVNEKLLSSLKSMEKARTAIESAKGTSSSTPHYINQITDAGVTRPLSRVIRVF